MMTNSVSSTSNNTPGSSNIPDDSDSGSLTKNMLIVNQSAPYSKANAKEALDLALAAATFDQDVSILFTGDACYQLMDQQDPEQIDSKNITKMLKALPIYGISQLYVDKANLACRNIKELAEGLAIKLVSADEIKKLYQDADAVVRF